ncbi:MAG: hypothetical protein CMO98_06360 [Woeseia sp.]|nr:hypothetical protein [Woeseia sp.]
MQTYSTGKQQLIRRVVSAFIACAPFAQANAAAEAAYCDVSTPGDVVVSRPQPNEPALDDVNWFARPVPNDTGDYIVAYATHNQNYLYNLTSGEQVAIPDTSDAVATPDGLFITVPSFYTPDHTVNFYETANLMAALSAGHDGRNIEPIFTHRDEKVFDTFYQSTGILSSTQTGADFVIRYRMMFSGSNPPTPPGFLIADYTVTKKKGETSFEPSPVLQLCPEIVGDMGTPFISKDGRYIVAHDNSDLEKTATLKLFEITGVDYSAQTTSCDLVIDFGFRASKADFSFDNSQVTFHLSTNDYITTFIDGGIDFPHITDIVIVDLMQAEDGSITGYEGISRLTTSLEPGVGNYFPAFFPDGKIFYIANKVPRNAPNYDVGPAEDRRFELRVLDPDTALRQTNIFDLAGHRSNAETIGRSWQQQCIPGNDPVMGSKSAWHFLSLAESQCNELVSEQWAGNQLRKKELLETCALAL